MQSTSTPFFHTTMRVIATVLSPDPNYPVFPIHQPWPDQTLLFQLKKSSCITNVIAHKEFLLKFIKWVAFSRYPFFFSPFIYLLPIFSLLLHLPQSQNAPSHAVPQSSASPLPSLPLTSVGAAQPPRCDSGRLPCEAQFAPSHLKRRFERCSGSKAPPAERYRS